MNNIARRLKELPLQGDIQRYSLCCGARPEGHLFSGRDTRGHYYSGRCSGCKEGSLFYTEAQLDDMDLPEEPGRHRSFSIPPYST